MLTTFFYLIIVPSILAFFLGYIAHGLKIMTQTPLEPGFLESDPLDSNLAQNE
jgi:hypothetical protein